MASINKKTIQDYWTKNVPGLDVVSKKYSPEQKEFYLYADEYRYRYDPYIIDLIDSFEDQYKVIAVDMSGFTNLSSFFKFINQILAKENINQVIIYGLSLGGVFAQNYAIKNFDKVSKIILSHTTSTKSQILKKKLIILYT